MPYVLIALAVVMFGLGFVFVGLIESMVEFLDDIEYRR